jgi:hypothetical protein
MQAADLYLAVAPIDLFLGASGLLERSRDVSTKITRIVIRPDSS